MTTPVEPLDWRLWMRKGRLVARRNTIKTIKRKTPSLFLLLQLSSRINMRFYMRILVTWEVSVAWPALISKKRNWRRRAMFDSLT